MRKWLKRIGLTVLALLVVGSLAGALYEQVGRHKARAEFPPPGRLVDIGGRRLHLDCRGTGSPIVVLEAGLDMNGSLSWAPVHDSIALTTRACAYSRAGIMWSDNKPGPHSAPGIASDLDAALTAAGEAPPYVMVGHSLGGPYIMAYTKQFPDKVAGLVFVDASHPDQVDRIAKATGKKMDSPLGGARALAAFAWTGLARLLIPVDTSSVPAAVGRTAAAYAPTSLGPMLEESAGMEETMTDAGALRTLGDRPLVVLTAMKAIDSVTLATIGMSPDQGRKLQAEWLKMHNEEASWSSASEHQVLPDATHYIQRDRPDVVIAAVRRVVERLRTPVDTTGRH